MAAAAVLSSEITLSLLDRLIDLGPQDRKEAPRNHWETARALEDALCRDLMALLNTRRGPLEFQPGYEECSASLLRFGVLDFTAYNLTNGIEQEQLRESMEQAIRRFEPRLERVIVSIIEPDPLRPILQFQISAMLRTNPELEPVVFDVSINRDSRQVAITGGA